ncbi:PREDICTED: uncharacterized protein At1g04910-like [Ipomoea nil]|uniref:uncharacterized protein At1g04910-like n=1 Tax=Ipomoea nil TaxID=35883 RepID=UPI00090175C5|nr:PREDICTED: uncharacterized protein At1g04910-like [Ipomoea nil]
MMKRRKQQRDELFIGLQCLLLRRRRRLHHSLPLFSALSASILFLFALISFVSPPTATNRRRLTQHHANLASGLFNNGTEEFEMNVEKETDFPIPTNGGSLSPHLWRCKHSKFYYGCSNSSINFPTAGFNTLPNRYLLIATSGGLNQQRTGIIDGVVAAHILNAAFVVPKLDHKSFWKDSSNFSEIFDVDWFISSLSNDVKVVKELPMNGGKTITPYSTSVPRKCNEMCYQTRILPLLVKKHAVRLRKFDYRLSNQLETDLQKLRCRVNYHALKFTDPILEMGRKLVERMRNKSKHFVALHLRFEPDMLAFSGCYYGGGDKERNDLGAIRKRWKSLHASNPDKERRHGKCPLTPEEVGLMLRALGFGNDVHIYVASGEIYGGEETLAPLKALFPNFYSKETIASKEELEPFLPFSARMAALDFIVCDESDVFVTNNNGNMARMLAGRRRYLGHRPTIRPNSKKLYRVFQNRNNMTWEAFASQVRTNQIGFMGEPMEVKAGRGEFHENPSSCICQTSDSKAQEEDVSYVSDDKNTTNTRESSGKLRNEEDEQGLSDGDYLESVARIVGQRELPKAVETDSVHPFKPDPLELEDDVFSD